MVVMGSGCASTRTAELPRDPPERIDTLKRAALYPWLDDGRCAVRESSGDWATLVERCYGQLDRARLRFTNPSGACPVAQAGLSGDQVARLVGICLLVQPELAVAAVVVVGAIVIAAAIAAELEAAQRTKRPKWCNCYCGKDPTPVLMNTLDFECRSECVLRGHAPTDYVCR